MNSEQFKKLGYNIVDELANYLDAVNGQRITADKTQHDLKNILAEHEIQNSAKAPEKVFSDAISLLSQHSFHGNHPRQWAYILPTVDPVASLAELIAGTYNQNVAGWEIAPMATEIEAQCLRWIADIIGFQANCGGVFVSGGNAANFTALLCARQNLRDSIAGANSDQTNNSVDNSKLTIYCSIDTHTWIDKFIDLFGLTRENIRLIEVNEAYQIRGELLEASIEKDLQQGLTPLAIVGTAGTTSTGAVDKITELAKIAKKHQTWLHIDGAYGAPAAICADSGSDLKALHLADSVAIDPHKWLYSPYEAGCVLVRDSELMRSTFTHVPKYYGDEEIEEGEINFYQFTMQNSRGFKALKVWSQLQVMGLDGLKTRIQTDIDHCQYLYDKACFHTRFQAYTSNLSIVTFRYLPETYLKKAGQTEASAQNEALNTLNKKILEHINCEGKFYISHTELGSDFVLRACFVNLKTQKADIDALMSEIEQVGALLAR